MPADAPEASFEKLWLAAVDTPIVMMEVEADESTEATAEALATWLRRLADECLAEGLVTEDGHAELQKCSETFARVLGSVAPAALRDKLMSLGGIEN